jgi:mono/diheme cytochrome c family protein
MLKRFLKPFRIVVVLVAAVAAFVGISVRAGGWATITVADLPDHFVAGQATTLSFTIRQHGVRLMDDLTPSLEAVNGTEKTTATVRREGANYHAKFTLPKPGEWTLTIKSSFGPNDVTLLPMQAMAANAKLAALSDAERGRRLFVAKGCLQCHKNDHAGVNGRFPWATDLTNKHYTGNYLAQVLTNPEKVLPPKDQARMPNLNLKPGEVTALTAFINTGINTGINAGKRTATN